MINLLDKNGFIINCGNKDVIQAEYLPIIALICNTVVKELSKDNIESIYIRGSVAIGKAMKDFSDIDCVVITKKPIPESRLKWRKRFDSNLRRKYSFVTLVDLTIVSGDELFTNPDYARLMVNLRSQSICVYGKDTISRIIPPSKPNKALALFLYKDIQKELNDLQKYFREEKNKRYFQGVVRPTKFWCVWIMRDILRSGLGLVMIKEPIYTQSLEDCCYFFCRVYPKYKDQMKMALFFERNPSSSKKEISKYLDSFLSDYLALWDKIGND